GLQCDSSGDNNNPGRPTVSNFRQLQEKLVFENLNTDKLNSIMRQDSLEPVLRDPCYLINEGICNRNIDQTMLSILLFFHRLSLLEKRLFLPLLLQPTPLLQGLLYSWEKGCPINEGPGVGLRKEGSLKLTGKERELEQQKGTSLRASGEGGCCYDGCGHPIPVGTQHLHARRPALGLPDAKNGLTLRIASLMAVALCLVWSPDLCKSEGGGAIHLRKITSETGRGMAASSAKDLCICHRRERGYQDCSLGNVIRLPWLLDSNPDQAQHPLPGMLGPQLPILPAGGLYLGCEGARWEAHRQKLRNERRVVNPECNLKNQAKTRNDHFYHGLLITISLKMMCEIHHTTAWQSLSKRTAGHTSLDIIIIKEIFRIIKKVCMNCLFIGFQVHQEPCAASCLVQIHGTWTTSEVTHSIAGPTGESAPEKAVEGQDSQKGEWSALSKWGLVLPVSPSVTGRLFVKLTLDPVWEGAERHTVHCSCHHSVPGFGPNQLLEPLFQDSAPLHHDSSWAPCCPPLPSASSSLFSCPPKSTFWALALQGSSRDPQRTRHFVCLRLSFLLPSFWTSGIFHEAKVKIASGASVVAIDNKIEQAMDLVKNHLMYAVREEVEILKEQIRELVEKNSQLERENTLLKTLASPEQLEKFQSRLSPEEPAPETPEAPEAPGGSAV
ncbi:hypothetical protein E2I00_016403, partial [Balaenoptera physalus]